MSPTPSDPTNHQPTTHPPKKQKLTNKQAQKFSVRTSLERGFRRYITRVADFDALLMAELQKLMKDTLAYNMMRRLRSDDEEPTCVLSLWLVLVWWWWSVPEPNHATCDATRRPTHPHPPTTIPPNKTTNTTRLEVPLSELEERAAELRIYDIRPFLASQLFRSHGLVVETVVDRSASVRMIRKLL